MIHLRLRTEYSFGQTFAPISRVIERLKEINCKAAGIVDKSTWGHVAWFNACVEAGIQPLLGVEVAVSDSDDLRHMWFLARNLDGLSEMYGATTKSHHQKLTTDRGKHPRLYHTDVERMSDNIIKFAGEITDGEWLGSIGAIIDLNPSSRVLNAKKMAIAKAHGLRVVSTADNNYSFPEDKQVYELISRAGVKPSPQHIVDSLENGDEAERIAAACVDLKLPVAPMIHYDGDLEALCRAGIEERKLTWTEKYEARLIHELNTIREKGFDSYFLVVSDMVRYAKQHMLVGPSRGSSAGSLVCYLSRITEIDPIPPGLFFERFIDITRSDLPDIDLDFPDDKRHMVFEYMAEKYGSCNTAKIGTISEFKPKSALIQVCKALGIPPTATGSVKAAIIERGIADSRAGKCLEDTFAETVPGQKFIASYPEARAAMLIEGHASHTGVHAAGLIVCNEDITKYCTIDADGIAHVEKGAAEKLGLLKIDVLGLRTLGILEDSGVKVDWYGLKFDDPKVYQVFNDGRMSGIFQFEGDALRDISRRVKFQSLREIDAVTALARPGPFGGGVTEEYLKRLNGERYEPIHPLVEQIMSESFGLPIYQEQTLAIVREIGKFGWAETSFVRRGISKRQGKEFFQKFWPAFRDGAMEQGIDERAAGKVWELINAMGAWQMNKAHTYSYAVISYWTAWLKTNHLLEFAAANLRSAKDEESAVVLLRELDAEGVKYIPFDIDRSLEDWSVQNGQLIGGFKALKGFGDVKSAKFVELRNSGKLTEKQRAEALGAESIFSNIYPISSRYANLIANPKEHGIGDSITPISTFNGEQEGSYVFIGELIHKNQRNANEEVLIKKRNGKKFDGPLDMMDIRVRDDTGAILARVGRFDYAKMGRVLSEETPIGAHMLIRARFTKGFRFAFIQRWKRIDQ